MRVILAGNNKISVEILKWLIENEEKIVALIPEDHDILNSKEDWEEPFLPFVKKYKNEIPCFVGNINLYSNQIKNLKPDLIACCRMRALVKKDILDIPTIGCTNLHYGELPKYGGVSPIQWAILNGENYIGVTLHFMTEKFDEGPIIDQRIISISKKKRILQLADREIKIEGLTAFEIYQKANELAIQIFIENYPLFKSKSVPIRNQDLSKKLYHKKGSINYEKDKYIDIDKKSDKEISRHVRAFTWPPRQLPIGRYNGKVWKELLLKDF